MLAGTTSGTGGCSGVPSTGAVLGFSSATKASSSAVIHARVGAWMLVMASQWPPHTWVGDQSPVYPSVAHNHACCPRNGGIQPGNVLSEPQNRAGQPVLGGRSSPCTARGAFRAAAGRRAVQP